MTATTDTRVILTGPMTQADYRADLTWLRHSTAKKLLPPSCPAIARYELDHPPEPTKAFTIGKALHRIVLDAGDDLVFVDADDYRTKAAREARDAADAEHKIPLLAKEAEQVLAMADALKKHKIASRLFDPDHGQPEQAIVWRDEAIPSLTRAALLDWLPEPSKGRLILAELKSATEAYPHEWSRVTASYGYHAQAAWQLDAVQALYPDADCAIVHVVQSKTAPYPPVVVQYDDPAIAQGREENRRAINVWHRCLTEDRWPGYDDPDNPEVVPVSLPPWALTLARA